MVLIAFAACSPARLPPLNQRAATAGSPLSAYQPERARAEGGTLIVGDWESPTNFAPLFNAEVTAAQVNATLFAGLTQLDSSLQFTPDLARRVPTLDNGGVQWDRGLGTMDVTYELRSGLRWSDGEPLTAEDVTFTWRVIVDRRTQGVLSTEGYELISRIDVREDGAFTLHFDRVYPAYLTLFTAVLPAHRLRQIPVERLAANPFWNRPDVVSGPYKISELVPDEHITLVRNEAWSSGRSGRRPHLDTIVYKVYPEVSQLLRAASVGQVDLALEIPESELNRLPLAGSLVSRFQPALAYEQVTFNQADPNPLTGKAPLWKDDPLLLQALRTAVDRQGLVESLLGGRAPVARSPIPSVLRAFQPEDIGVRFDVERARQMLESDGWTLGEDGIRSRAGTRLSFTLTTSLGNPLRLQVQERLIADWRRLGAEVVARNRKPVELFSGYAEGGTLARGGFEAGLWTWSIGPDPDGVYPIQHSSQIPTDLNRGRGSNFGRFRSRDIDRTLDEGRSSIKPADRVTAYAAFQRAYARLSAELPLYERVLTVLATPRLHNLTPNAAPDTTLWNVVDWWLESG